MLTLYHFTDVNLLDKIFNEGLIPISKYEKFTSLRDDVIFCWLSPNDNKLTLENQVC